MVDIYIRTRGLRIDYSFLLKQPPRLYPNNYKNKSDIEKPTCILERTQENGVYMFLSGIPSQRKDHQGTPIRYELVAISEPWDYLGDSDEKKYLKGLTGLISMWLKDVRGALQKIQEDGKEWELVRFPNAKNSKLGELLDETLTEEYVEKLLQLTVDSKQSKDDEKNLNEKLKDFLLKDNFLQEYSKYDSSPQTDNSLNCWWGGVNNNPSYEQWITLVKKLLLGETEGKAMLLNIATPQSLSSLSVKDEELGVLLAKEWSSRKPEKIKITDLSQTDTEIPEALENLLSDPRIPQEIREPAKNLAKEGIHQRQQLWKFFFPHQSD